MRGICAAVIGLSLAAITTAGAAEPLTKPFAYDNVHIRVADPQKAAEWYVKALGAKPSEAPTPQTAQVSFGAQAITITKGDSTASSMGTLIDHFGLSFSDLDAAVKQAQAAGAKVTAQPAMSPGIFRYAYIEDPWGVRIEMVEDKQKLGFHHVHLRVKDPTATLNWFEQNIGGERTKLYGKLDGMRYNGVWLFAMASGDTAPAPPTAADARAVLDALAATGYDRAVSIEMKAVADDGMAGLAVSVGHLHAAARDGGYL